MSELDFHIAHRAGIKHQAAETILRLPKDRADKTKLDENIVMLDITTNMASNNKTNKKQDT